MNVILFGATGMIGQGVLRECLLDSRVTRVLAVGRTPVGRQHEKFRNLVHRNLLDFSAVEDQFDGCDACFFCLGVSSAGMKEDDYRRITYDMPLAAANALLKRSPGLTFIYVSGMGTDSTGRGRIMWARVKGQTEQALLQLPFKAVYCFRPAFVQPLHGITSKTPMYNAVYLFLAPLYPLWRAIVPKYVTTTERIGRAMIDVAERGAARPILENDDINRV